MWYERALKVRSDWEIEHPGFVPVPFTKDWDIIDSMITGVCYGPLCDVPWVDIFKTTYFPLDLFKGTSLDYYVDEEMKRQGGKALAINRKRAKVAELIGRLLKNKNVWNVRHPFQDDSCVVTFLESTHVDERWRQLLGTWSKVSVRLQVPELGLDFDVAYPILTQEMMLMQGEENLKDVKENINETIGKAFKERVVQADLFRTNRELGNAQHERMQKELGMPKALHDGRPYEIEVYHAAEKKRHNSMMAQLSRDDGFAPNVD